MFSLNHREDESTRWVGLSRLEDWKTAVDDGDCCVKSDIRRNFNTKADSNFRNDFARSAKTSADKRKRGDAETRADTSASAAIKCPRSARPRDEDHHALVSRGAPPRPPGDTLGALARRRRTRKTGHGFSSHEKEGGERQLHLGRTSPGLHRRPDAL